LYIKTECSNTIKTNRGFCMDEFFKVIGEKYGEEAATLARSEFPKYAVPKEQYNKKADEAKTAAAQLDELNAKVSEIDGLRTKATEADSLKALLESTKGDFEKRLSDNDKRGKLNLELFKAKANPDALDFLASQLKLDEVEPDKFGEHIEKLRTERPSFFATVVSNSPAPVVGVQASADDALWSKVENVFKSK